MDELIRALGRLDRVVGVGIGGSRGLRIASEASDFDLVLFRRGGERVDAREILDALRACAGVCELRDPAGFVSGRLGTHRFEIFQKDLLAIEREIGQAREGAFTWSIRQLFPHGDLSTGLISHVVHLIVCSDPDGHLERLRAAATPFPVALRAALVDTFLQQADITVTHAAKISRRLDLQYLVGLCSGFVFFANLLVFAVNGVYPVLEKGGSLVIARLPQRPTHYEQRIAQLFSCAAAGDYPVAVAMLETLLGELRFLAVEGRRALAADESVRTRPNEAQRAGSGRGAGSG